MIENILSSFSLYYGLDWLTFAFGITGFYMLTNKNPLGFVLSILACFGGLTVASMAGQFGFIVHNAILIMIMVRGLILWRRDETVK